MRREAESADLELEATGKEGEEGEDKAKDNETEEEYEEHEEHEEGEEEAATREVKLRQEESDSGAKRPAQKLGFSLRGGELDSSPSDSSSFVVVGPFVRFRWGQ